MSRFQTAICYVSATALLLALAMAPPPALAHGGHGKPELQFILSPTQPISDPDVALIKIDGIEISRAEFLAYIRAVAAFQMRADLLQRDFMLHYWIAEGLSRYYPADINEVMPLAGERSSEFTAAKLAYRLLGYVFMAPHDPHLNRSLR